MSIFLSDLLTQSNLEFKSITGNPIVTGISDNSATIQPGNVFVAVRGYKVDGHNYIVDAVTKGAAAIVAQELVSAPVPVIVVTESRIALAKLSDAWYNFPAKNMAMIGVTASNGKTTTAFMIDHILSAHFPTTGLIGTVIVKDGLKAVSADLTTPGSRELFELLATMNQNNCSHVTMEVSSAGLELHRVHGIPYKIAIFNNVSREHIDFHGTFENYWNQKSRLIRELSSGTYAILNADDSLILGLKNQTNAEVVTYGLKNDNADVLVQDIDLTTGAGKYTYVVPKQIQLQERVISAGSLDVNLKVLGLHNIYNSAAAITVAKLCGVPDETIVSALADFTGVERRFQLIYDQEYKIIDDHFANAGNIDITLETLNLMKYNKLILLAAIRGNRGSIVNRENAEALAKWVPKLPLQQVLVTDSIDCVDENDMVSPEERKAFLDILDQEQIKYTHFSTLSEGIKTVLEQVQPGDVVLLGGPQGMDHGAHIILPLVAAHHPSQKQQEILKILVGRVAGSA